MNSFFSLVAVLILSMASLFAQSAPFHDMSYMFNNFVGAPSATQPGESGMTTWSTSFPGASHQVVYSNNSNQLNSPPNARINSQIVWGVEGMDHSPWLGNNGPFLPAGSFVPVLSMSLTSGYSTTFGGANSNFNLLLIDPSVSTVTYPQYYQTMSAYGFTWERFYVTLDVPNDPAFVGMNLHSQWARYDSVYNEVVLSSRASVFIWY